MLSTKQVSDIVSSDEEILRPREVNCLWMIRFIDSGKSIVALLNRFSLLIHTTRMSAIEHLAAVVKAYLKWRPKCFSKGANRMDAPAPPIKFLDIGTRMGLHEVEGLIPDMKDRSNVLHPRASPGIPKPGPGTFYEVMHEKLGKRWVGDQLWCDPNAWAKHSPSCDFHVADPLGNIWNLPIIIPTCPRSYTLHASSSDLTTWNTLAMVRMELQGFMRGTERNLSCRKIGEDMLMSDQSG